MHPATIQSLGGMVAIVRQALIGIEAIVAAESQPALAQTATLRDNQQSSGNESQELTNREEETLAKLFGITNE